MTEYQIQLSKNAERDLTSIYDYIALDLLSPEAAWNVYERLQTAIRSLKQMPERFALVTFEPERQNGVRCLPVGKYVILYSVKDDTVSVFRVLYGLRDIPGLLHESDAEIFPTNDVLS